MIKSIVLRDFAHTMAIGVNFNGAAMQPELCCPKKIFHFAGRKEI